MNQNLNQSFPQNTTENGNQNISPKRIPASVMVVACLYLAVGVGGFVVHFKDLRAPDGLWIEITEFLAIVCGAFLLRAQNWARWLAVAWMAFHVAISFGLFGELAVHSLFLVLIVWCLFGADASRFFRGAHAA